MKPVLEVCTHSVESAVSAERGGAMRLELCANLMIGGTSPDEDLFRMVRERVSVPVRVLLRPRCGDFLYTESEFELLCRQVKRFAALGADGIVIGVLTPEGDLDEERMAKLISLAGGCGVTLHRAFDVCRDPFAALETAKRLGVDTILTSGQQADCTAGADLLRALVAKAGEDVQILVGAGVNADVIRDLQPKTGANAFHLSAKRVENSRMQFRRENVPMGLPGLSEFSLWRCDENAVRAAREAFTLIASAVGNPDIYVLASMSGESSDQGFLYDLMEPMNIVDIYLPDELERRQIWNAIAHDHPSVRELDLSRLTRFSRNLSRFDIVAAGREAVEDAYRQSLKARRYVPVSQSMMFEHVANFQPLESEEYRFLEEAVVTDFKSGLDDLLEDIFERDSTQESLEEGNEA